MIMLQEVRLFLAQKTRIAFICQHITSAEYDSQLFNVSFTVHIQWSAKISKVELTQGRLWHCCSAAFRLRVWIIYYMCRTRKSRRRIHLRTLLLK